MYAGSGQSHEPDEDHYSFHMPLPPMQYIKNYSDEALRRGCAPPPPPPITDSYLMFGQPFSTEDCIVPSLESQVIAIKESDLLKLKLFISIFYSDHMKYS